MKRFLVAAVAVVLVAAAAGLGVTQSGVVGSDGKCPPPRTILGSESDASIVVLETYISDNIAPTFKHPEELQWASDDFAPTITPGKIAARIMVIQGYGSERYYHVTLVRDCQGGEWKVVEFKPLPG